MDHARTSIRKESVTKNLAHHTPGNNLMDYPEVFTNYQTVVVAQIRLIQVTFATPKALRVINHLFRPSGSLSGY